MSQNNAPPMSPYNVVNGDCIKTLLIYFHGPSILFNIHHFDKASLGAQHMRQVMKIKGNDAHLVITYLELLEKEHADHKFNDFESFLSFLRENETMFGGEDTMVDASQGQVHEKKVECIKLGIQELQTLVYSPFGEYYEGLTRKDKERMVKIFNCISVNEGDKVLEQGECSSFAVIVLNGVLGAVASESAGGSHPVPVNRGQILGAEGYFKTELRTHRVVAAKNSKLLIVSYKQLDSLMDTAADGSLRAKVVTMLGRAAISSLSRCLDTALEREESIVPPAMDTQPEFLFRQLDIEDEISFANDVDGDSFVMENEEDKAKQAAVITERRATLIQAESRSMEARVHELTHALSVAKRENIELSGQLLAARDEITLGMATVRETKVAANTSNNSLSPTLGPQQVVVPSSQARRSSTTLRGEALSNRIETLPADMQSWIKNFQDQYQIQRTELGETSAVAEHYKSRWEMAAKEYEQDMQGVARRRELYDDTIRDLKKNNNSYAMLVKFISVQNYVKSWRMRNSLRAVFKRAARVSSNVMLALLESKHDQPSNQFDNYDSLLTRASRLSKGYPWGKKRKIPFHILLKHLDVEVALIETKSAELVEQKKKWKETSDSFFERTVELRKEFLDRKDDNEEVGAELEGLTQQIADRDETIEHLKRELVDAHDRHKQQQEVVDEGGQKRSTDLKTVRKEARTVFDRTVFLKRRVVQLEAHLESLQNQKANTDRDIRELNEKRKGEEAALRAQQRERAAAAASNLEQRRDTGADGNLMPGWNFSAQVDRSTAKQMRLRTSGMLAPSTPCAPTQPAPGRRSGAQTARTYRWRAAKKSAVAAHGESVDLSDMVLPDVQPLFKVRYKSARSGGRDRHRL